MTQPRWWPLGVIGVAIVLASFSFIHRPRDSQRIVEAAQQLRHGHIPLWDSRHGYGEPLLAKGRLPAFSPTILPLFISSRAAWPLRDAVRMILAGLAAGTIISRRGGTNRRALAFASCYAAATGILGHIFDPAAEIWCWLAWSVLAIDCLIARASSLRVALASISFALAFAVGEPFFAAALIVVCIGYLAGGSLSQKRLLPFPATILAMLIGFGLSGAVWWSVWNARNVIVNSTPLKAPASIWFVDHMQWASSRADAQNQVAQDIFDPKKLVLLDDNAAPEWSDLIKYLKANPNAIRSIPLKPRDVELSLSDATPGHWRLDVPRATGWVVIAQTYNPDWSARVVGKGWPLRERRDKAVLPADGGLIAIPILEQDAGVSGALLELDYRPASWRQGVVISAASAAAWLALLGFSLLGRAGELRHAGDIIPLPPTRKEAA